MHEFAIIDHYFKNLFNNLFNNNETKIGIGDDCAVVNIQDYSELLITTDTMVEGTHFLASAPPHSLGHKALAVSLSDIAAMGGTPKWVLLNISIPKYNQQWFSEFSDGFAALAKRYQINLIGGDTTRVINKGPISITTTVLGIKSKQDSRILSRSNAQLGDGIFITGSLGEPNYILEQLKLGKKVKEHNKLYYPEPRVSVGQFIADYANAAIDLSDGLIADLGHILKQSSATAVINLDWLPIENIANIRDQENFRNILSGGDEYELIFTAPIEYKDIIKNNNIDINITQIGQIISDNNLNINININNNNIIKVNNIYLQGLEFFKNIKNIQEWGHGWEHF
ncbi:MAG: thiamine-phosphate kinase [Gammaproteobacteria bacterium]|nr:thiamine-phosphate kinase [Gammaproteobacteria bacterium]